MAQRFLSRQLEPEAAHRDLPDTGAVGIKECLVLTGERDYGFAIYQDIAIFGMVDGEDNLFGSNAPSIGTA